MKTAVLKGNSVMDRIRFAPIANVTMFATALIMLALLLAPGPSFANTHPGGPLTPLTVKTSNGEYTYQVELAVTNEQKTKGLMFRRQMPGDQGMLFEFGQPRMVLMWMKNTILPLDMIFMKTDGTIAHVAENTTPFSLDTISSQVPVSFVLELNAGEAARTGMKPGQKMEHAIFSKTSN